MPMRVCSLKYEAAKDGQQLIKPGDYRLIRFPFAASDESYDADGMHDTKQPDGVTATFADERSGLIWPTADGWADLYAMIYLEAADYTEYRDRFVRDPLGLTPKGPDSTCTRDRAITPGGQYVTKHWGIFVHPGTPIGLLAEVNSSTSVALTLAEFKMAIHT